MMIRDYIYYMITLISFISVLSIIFAFKNKKRRNNKLIFLFSIINILYLFIATHLIYDFFHIIVDIRFSIFCFISFIGSILYVISLIICIIKNRKLVNNSDNKNIFNIFIVILLIPIIAFIISLFREISLINNSEIVLSYFSYGDGGIGGMHKFVYVVSDKNCKEISVDVDFFYEHYNKKFLLKNLIKITENDMHNNGIDIIFEIDDMIKYIIVYKNNELIHKKQLNDEYYNIVDERNKIYVVDN